MRQLLFVTAAVAVGVAAWRGHRLLGPAYAAVCAGVTLALLGLVARSRTPAGISWPRAAVSTAMLVLGGAVMAAPTLISPDVRHAIDQVSTGRAARAELVTLFGSDPAFRGLSVATEYRKCVCVTVGGSLRTLGDFERLRARVGAECPVVGRCVLVWEIETAAPRRQFSGWDRELFGNPDGT